MKCTRIFTPVIFLAGCFGTVLADVVDSSATGFTVRSTAAIAGPPEVVYHHLVKNVGKWWDPAHTFSGNADNLSIDDTAQGCFCERLEGGGSVRHLTVILGDPGKTLRMAGGLGPLQSMAVTGSITWSLSPTDEGTMVELTYTVGGYRPGGLQALARPVDRVLFLQLTRLKNFAEGGDDETER